MTELPARGDRATDAAADPQRGSDSDPGGRTARIDALDALRGFALCGIIFINIPQTLDMLPNLGVAPDGLRYFVLGRFYPIFYFLFGIGFGIFLRSAARRTDKSRLVLSRRLIALIVFGVLHHLLQPGEVLLWFGVAGLIVLLPLSLLARRTRLIIAIVLTLVGLLAGVGGFGILPGLFALGFSVADYRIPETLHRRTGQLVVVLLVAGCIGAATVLWLTQAPPAEVIGRRVGLVASSTMAAAYATALLLVLLRTPLGRPISALLAPMGRVALTNYLSATVLFVTIGTAIGLTGTREFGRMALLAAGILLVQAGWSPLWLSRFRYGPLEWVWRCVTWWEVVPNRKVMA